MHRTHLLKSKVIVCTLLILSSCAPEQETEENNVRESRDTLQVETPTQGHIVEVASEELFEQQIKESVAGTEQGSSGEELLFDIAERILVLQYEFANADHNEDGYLELNELPAKQFGRIEGAETYVHPDPYDAKFSTTSLELLQRGFEEEGIEDERLHNVKQKLVQRYDFEFDIADSNGDNELTRDEYGNRYGRMDMREKRQRFTKLDSNQDGLVDWREYSVEIPVLRELDQNGDGIVSNEEGSNDAFSGLALQR